MSRQINDETMDYTNENISGDTIYSCLGEYAKYRYGRLIRAIHHVDTKIIGKGENEALRIQGWIELDKFIEIMSSYDFILEASIQIRGKIVEIWVWLIGTYHINKYLWHEQAH